MNRHIFNKSCPANWTFISMDVSIVRNLSLDKDQHETKTKPRLKILKIFTFLTCQSIYLCQDFLKTSKHPCHDFLDMPVYPCHLLTCWDQSRSIKTHWDLGRPIKNHWDYWDSSKLPSALTVLSIVSANNYQVFKGFEDFIDMLRPSLSLGHKPWQYGGLHA